MSQESEEVDIHAEGVETNQGDEREQRNIGDEDHTRSGEDQTKAVGKERRRSRSPERRSGYGEGDSPKDHGK